MSSSLDTHGNEENAAQAFSRQSVVFDQLYGGDTIIRYKRQRVRKHIEQWLPPSACMLELNAGTGEDAIYFVTKGHRVHATDISTGMLGQLKAKKHNTGIGQRLSIE